MATEDDSISMEDQQEEQEPTPDADDRDSNASDSDSDSSDSDYDYDYDYSKFAGQQEGTVVPYTRPGDEPPPEFNTPEINIARFSEALDSLKEDEDDEEEEPSLEELYDFPEDKEDWREEDLKELWADAPMEYTKPGWDPVWADERDWEVMRKEEQEGRDPPIAPFYLPYRPPYPVIPDNHYDIATPKAVVEELDRIEEFLTWVSFIFPDGSTYEGTVWDDLAHGKGVYVAEQGLVRYEGEWLRNNMEGHGVAEVDIPDIEPVPGSKLEAKMRADGEIISREFMPPEDREWLEKDIEDTMHMIDGNYEIPFYEKEEWIKYFGRKPEVGRYRYAGEWKHGRMHGCGVYEVNERVLYGRFYFGEFVDEATDCNEDISALHAGLAEVAAAKARMFVNKPDGMVREDRGPYSDPQHPYFYEDEDVWMAPGFINQFYEVPDFWKRYVEEVDKEREMWLNSFYKAPLRLPMPSELEYWWENDEEPEFVVLNKEPEPDPEDPSKLVYTEDPVILHTKTGRIINFIEDEEHGIRLFWQPVLKDGEEFDPEKVEFLPLGFDEFYGKETVVRKPTFFERLLTTIENKLKPMVDNLDKWFEEKKKTSELNKKLLQEEFELAEAELALEEAIEDMDEDFQIQEEEEEQGDKTQKTTQEDEGVSVFSNEDQKPTAEEEEGVEDEEEEEEEEEEDIAPSSFGSVTQDEDLKKTEQKGNGPGGSRFSSCSMSLASSSLLSAVSWRLQFPFSGWKSRSPKKPTPTLHAEFPEDKKGKICTVSFPTNIGLRGNLRAKSHRNPKFRSVEKSSHLHSLSQILPHPNPINQRREKMAKKQSHGWLHAAPERDSDTILSLHLQLNFLESNAGKAEREPLYLQK